MTGEDSPMPTGTCQFRVSSLGQTAGALNPVTLLSRLGPRHWGQSWARARLAPSSSTATPSMLIVHLTWFMVLLLIAVRGWPGLRYSEAPAKHTVRGAYRGFGVPQPR